MPTYQYACTACDHAFEQVQSFHEDSLTECPQCTGRLRKIFNAVGVVFKGSGFYRTDSRTETAKDGAKGGSGSTSAGTSDSSAGTSTSDSSSGSKTASKESGSGSSSTPKAAAGAA